MTFYTLLGTGTFSETYLIIQNINKMKYEKQKLLNEAYDAAYNADCSEGLTAYRTPALDCLQKDVDDSSVTKESFIDSISKILKQIL